MARAKKKPARKSRTAAKQGAPAKKKAAAGRVKVAKKKARAKKSSSRRRFSVTYDFMITVDNGQIGFDATSDDGNGYANSRPSNRDVFHWRIADPDYEFKLVFRRMKCKGAGAGAHWPFPGTPPGSATDWVTEFEGEAKNVGLYKYTVHVQHKITGVPLTPLDPVIIIGRV